MICIFTSVTASYIPNARILAASVKRAHPEWHFVLLLNDLTPQGVTWGHEPFDEVFFSHWLPIRDFRRWAFGYSAVEYCTATKGLMAEQLMKRPNVEAVVYLDPDTVVFSPLTEIESM